MPKRQNTIQSRDARPSVMFIHSVIDDYGLDPYAFRVYARLARRAGSHSTAFESVIHMAEACKMSDRTVQRSLKTLINEGLISSEERPGYTTIYTLLPVESWQNKVINTPEANDSGDTVSGVVPTHIRGTPEPQSDEVTPYKGNPIEGKKDMSAKPTIDYDSYIQAWNDHCGTLPQIRLLNDWRKTKIKEHTKLHKQDALHIFTQAVQQVANEEWWTTNNYGIDSLLRGKITTYAEKHQATKTTRRPAILNINPEDLF